MPVFLIRMALTFWERRTEPFFGCAVALYFLHKSCPYVSAICLVSSYEPLWLLVLTSLNECGTVDLVLPMGLTLIGLVPKSLGGAQ